MCPVPLGESMLTRLRAFAILSVVTLGVRAGDFGPLMDAVKASWPEKTHIAVVADYEQSAAEIQDLAQAAGAGTVITVLDTHKHGYYPAAYRVVVNRIKPDYVVLLRHDSTCGEGTPESSWLVGQVAAAGIPSIGTSPVAIRQGAVFAVGNETGNQILVNSEIKGSIHVVLPARDSFRVSAARLEGPARIQRIEMGRH